MNVKLNFVSRAIVAIPLFAFIAFQGNAFASDSNSQPYLITKREIPKQYDRTYRFLEFIKDTKTSNEAFDANKAPHWEVTEILSFIANNGVTFTDVNGYINGHFSTAVIRKALISRKGQIFITFAHLAHIYSIPYTQYSSLSFDSIHDGVVVHIAEEYDLTFKNEKGLLYLTDCSYKMLEGD